MKCVLLINRAIDIPLFVLLQKTAPIQADIILVNFSAKDEYGWKKPKSLQRWLTKQDIASVKGVADTVTVCSSKAKFKSLVAGYDICVSKGREFFIFKPIAKKNVALSFTGTYLARLIDCLPFYEDGLKIFLQSNSWTENDCENLVRYSGESNSQFLSNYQNKFICQDVLGEYYNVLSRKTKEQIRKELSIPLDKKVAFLSFRKADRAISIHQNDSDFLQKTIDTVKEAKRQGYFVISRRRMGVEDINRRSHSSEVRRPQEVLSLVDMEADGYGGYPDKIYQMLYASDVMLLMDTSGICQVEGAICRCPTYMPFENNDKFDQLVTKLNAPMQEMFAQGLIFNELSEEKLTNYHDKIDSFVDRWYNTDIDSFWKSVIE